MSMFDTMSKRLYDRDKADWLVTARRDDGTVEDYYLDREIAEKRAEELAERGYEVLVSKVESVYVPTFRVEKRKK